MKFTVKLSLLVIVLLNQSCTTNSNIANRANASSMGQLIIAEPLAINYKNEIALARLTEIIQRAEITEVQRAKLFYERGVIYDSFGLRSLARLDFNRALHLKPNFVEAYNFLGIHYTQLQEFAQAYDSFDSAIELEPSLDFAYLNRGIALYYGGRAKLSLEDFNTFYTKQTNDPYRALWLYLAETRVDKKEALIQLKKRAYLVDNSVWAKQLIQLFLGDLSQDNFLKQLPQGVSSNQVLTNRLCEAYFYLGKYNLMNGRKSIASNYFKLALSTNVYEFVEHRYAKLELDLIREELKGRNYP